MWCAAVGLVDEFVDMPKEFLFNQNRNNTTYFINQGIQIALVTFMITIIPLLMNAHEVFIQSAILKLTSEVIAGKLDNPIFHLIAIVGMFLICKLMLSMRFANFFATITSWPLFGMTLVAIGKFLYEIHDENPSFIRLSKVLRIPSKLWDYCTETSLCCILVIFQFLPIQFLTLAAPIYSISKLGMALPFVAGNKQNVEEERKHKKHSCS